MTRHRAWDRPVLAGIALAVLCSAATACDDSRDNARPAPEPHHSATTSSSRTTDVTVLVSDPTGASMEALGGGRIEVVGTCLGAAGRVIIWPPGTHVVSRQPLTINIPGKGDYSTGDTVRLGGGNVSDPSDRRTEPINVGDVRVPSGCMGRGVFLAGPQSP